MLLAVTRRKGIAKPTGISKMEAGMVVKKYILDPKKQTGAITDVVYECAI